MSVEFPKCDFVKFLKESILCSRRTSPNVRFVLHNSSKTFKIAIKTIELI